MTGSIQRTAQVPYTVLYSTDVTAGSITLPIPTLTAPTGDGYIAWAGAGASVGNLLALIFTATGGSGVTATARVNGWRRVSAPGKSDLWVCYPLLALSLTTGTQHGVAATPLVAAEYLVTTITASTAFTTADEIINPGDNSLALVKLDPAGAEVVQVQLAVGTATAVNAAWSNF